MILFLSIISNRSWSRILDIHAFSSISLLPAFECIELCHRRLIWMIFQHVDLYFQCLHLCKHFWIKFNLIILFKFSKLLICIRLFIKSFKLLKGQENHEWDNQHHTNCEGNDLYKDRWLERRILSVDVSYQISICYTSFIFYLQTVFLKEYLTKCKRIGIWTGCLWWELSFQIPNGKCTESCSGVRAYFWEQFKETWTQGILMISLPVKFLSID